jgi:hypothetical protein
MLAPVSTMPTFLALIRSRSLIKPASGAVPVPSAGARAWKAVVTCFLIVTGLLEPRCARRESLVECPVARSLDCIGEWWSLLILRDAFQGFTRFDEFHKSLGLHPTYYRAG